MNALFLTVLSLVLSADDWDADSLVVSLRQADRTAQSAGLTAGHFEEPPQRDSKESIEDFERRVRDWERRVAPRRAVLATLENLPLFRENQWVTLAPSAVIVQPDGSLLIEGAASVRAQVPTLFITDLERRKQEGWKEKRKYLVRSHKSKRNKRWLFGKKYNESELAEEYRRKLEDFDARRDEALQEIHEAVAARVEAYRTVALMVIGDRSLAERIDTAKLTLVRQARVLFRISDVGLSPPIPDANVPVVVAAIRGELLGVEDGLTRGQGDAQPTNVTKQTLGGVPITSRTRKRIPSYPACKEWGKSDSDVETLSADYAVFKQAGVSKDEMLEGSQDACAERASSPEELERCRSCVTQIINDLFSD